MYCDTKILERNWYHWLIGNPTPQLEDYRKAGLLLTKVVASKPNGTKKYDPFWGLPTQQNRSHCLAIDTGIYFNSYNGRCDEPKKFIGGKPEKCELPLATLQPNQAIINKMVAKGYVIERPNAPLWGEIANSVHLMCKGISTKFNRPSDDERDNLAQEAFVQVLKKIKERKLVYTPGKAPVFNLVTTTIYRIIFSVLNKEGTDRKNRAKHMQAVIPQATRGHSRSRGRYVTSRVFGSLVTTPT